VGLDQNLAEPGPEDNDHDGGSISGAAFSITPDKISFPASPMRGTRARRAHTIAKRRRVIHSSISSTTFFAERGLHNLCHILGVGQNEQLNGQPLDVIIGVHLFSFTLSSSFQLKVIDFSKYSLAVLSRPVYAK
jgi:hypothetical protein